MFRLFNRSKENTSSRPDYKSVKVDLHSHLIPGIDDGSPDMDTSIKLIRGLKELGYQKIITTPHIMWDMYRNTYEGISEKLEELKIAVKKNGIDIDIQAGAEYFLDEHMEQLLKNNKPLLTIGGKMVLVEFSLAFPSHSTKDILFQMEMMGYQPVIAHPERYIYLEQMKDFYDELKDIGCLFQLNILALGNYYGKSVQELAHYLIKKDYYDLVGSDLHHARHLEALQSASLAVPLKKLMDSGRIRNSQL